MNGGKDEASIFKQKNLKAIRRNRILRKILFFSMAAIALALMIAVLMSYILDKA